MTKPGPRDRRPHRGRGCGVRGRDRVRDGLEARHLAYVVGIAATVGVWPRPPKATVPPYRGRGQPPTRTAYGTQRPMAAHEVVATATGLEDHSVAPRRRGG